MEYCVPVMYRVFGHVFVKADNKEDLANKLRDDRFVEHMPLAVNPEYVEDSYEIDFDSEFSDENGYFFLED